MPDIITDYFNKLVNNLLLTFNSPGDYLDKIALTAVVFIIGWVLYIIFKKVITSNIRDYKRRYTIHKVLKSTIIIVMLLFVLFIWIQAINALILMALIIGVFIVFMVKGLTNNIIGYFIIRYRKYFKVGHRIEINGVIGDVVEINLVGFELLEARKWLSSDANTGRIIKLPNRIIFDQSIEMIGVTNQFIWQEIKYVLSFDSNWQVAEQIMIDVGNSYFTESVVPSLEEDNNYLPSKQAKLRPVFSLNTNDDGIILILRYLVDYKKGTKVRTFLQRQILSKFEEHSQIKFAAHDIRIIEKQQQ